MPRKNKKLRANKKGRRIAVAKTSTTEKTHPLIDVVKGLFYYFQNKWFIKSVIAAAPYLIAVILSLTPLQKYFVTDNRVNLWGIVLIILGGALTVLQVLSNKFSSDIYDDGKSFQAENQVRSKIMETEHKYEEDKNILVSDGFRSIAYDNNDLIDFIQYHIKPKERIRIILSKIGECIGDICDLPSQNIHLSAAVSCDNSDWEWICEPTFEGAASLSELISGDSTFRRVMEKEVYCYKNSKAQAIEKKEYISDRKDITEKNIGSIICWEVSINIFDKDSKMNHPFRMIISISTYGRQLLVSDGEVTVSDEDIDYTYKDVIHDMVLSHYHGELQETLIWHGISHLKSK